MNFKRILTAVSLTFLISVQQAYAADIDFDNIREEQCTRYYKQIDIFLQYLYRADGNLKELSSSKIKRIEYLDGVFSDYNASDSKRRTAFDELFTDPDWWIYKLQRNSRKLIDQIESFKQQSDWDSFKKLATQQADRQIKAFPYIPSATWSMDQTVDLIYATADFFSKLTEIKSRLEELGASSRLSRAFSENSAYEQVFLHRLPSSLMKCQINFLARRLDK